MRTNATCPACGQAVRIARNHLGVIVMVDPIPAKDGVVWVDGFNVGGEVRVNVAAHRDDVPNNEPLRYFLHACGGEG